MQSLMAKTKEIIHILDGFPVCLTFTVPLMLPPGTSFYISPIAEVTRGILFLSGVPQVTV